MATKKIKVSKTISIDGVDGLSKRLRSNTRVELAKIFRYNQFRLAIGDVVIDDIKRNANFGAPETSTVRWRRYYEQYNPTDPAYNIGKLNAVFTGELLEDLRESIIANPTEFYFQLQHSSGNHSRYKGKTKLVGKKTPYRIISDYLINELGYDYMRLSSKAVGEINDLVKERILYLVRRISGV